MATQCPAQQLEFEGLGRRQIVANFDGGRMTSDGGALLLREADRLFNVTERVAGAFVDYRDPSRIEHDVTTLVAQRIIALALGYEDLNDHDRLRDGPALALACGIDDVEGARRVRERDRGHVLAASSTLNRLELGDPNEASLDRYKKIVADHEALDRLLVDLFLESHAEPPKEIVLDLDATDDPVHGDQEGKSFHGYDDHHGFLPLFVVCGEHILRCRLRTADHGAADGSVDELSRIVEQIRGVWPRTRIVVRGDCDFGTDDIMVWCEDHGVDYVFGYGQNPRLNSMVTKALNKSRRRCLVSGKPSRRYRDLRYRTQKSWSRERRVVAKAEWLPGPRGKNARYIVTSISRKEVGARELYEQRYCARGDMENRIKDQQLWLFSDRTSCHVMRANQLRMYFSAFAGAIVDILRRVGLHGTECARWRVDTIRSRLFKLAGRVTKTVRRLRLSFASIFPLQEVFARTLVNLRAAAQAPPPG